MTSWRDQVSAAAAEDLDNLVTDCLNFAIHLLTKYGEFYPFAYIVDPAGEIVGVMTPLEDEHPESKVLAQTIREALRDNRDKFRTAALVTDELVTGLGDAVRVVMEHREGITLAALLPYQLHQLGQEPTLGELIATGEDPFVWITPQT